MNNFGFKGFKGFQNSGLGFGFNDFTFERAE